MRRAERVKNNEKRKFGVGDSALEAKSDETYPVEIWLER